MIIEAFKREHLDALTLQPMQQYMRPLLMRDDYLKFYESQESFTAIIDGVVVGCGGFISMWANRVQIWSLLARDIGPRGMLQVHHAVKRGLAMRTERRIEAMCDPGFKNAQRWLQALGFEREGLMRKYTEDGHDCYLYARVR